MTFCYIQSQSVIKSQLFFIISGQIVDQFLQIYDGKLRGKNTRIVDRLSIYCFNFSNGLIKIKQRVGLLENSRSIANAGQFEATFHCKSVIIFDISPIKAINISRL